MRLRLSTNIKITNVEVTIEGILNLGLCAYQESDETKKFLAASPASTDIRGRHGTFNSSSRMIILHKYSATKAFTKKKDILYKLAFSGHHVEQRCWVALFQCKDQDAFED